MRHAYLLIADRNFKQLKKLISVLDDARNDIYLLIDRKSRNAPAPAEFSTSFRSAAFRFTGGIILRYRLN